VPSVESKLGLSPYSSPARFPSEPFLKRRQGLGVGKESNIDELIIKHAAEMFMYIHDLDQCCIVFVPLTHHHTHNGEAKNNPA
jgi:hypothetical protein